MSDVSDASGVLRESSRRIDRRVFLEAMVVAGGVVAVVRLVGEDVQVSSLVQINAMHAHSYFHVTVLV